jgi:hypothetical protein
VANGLAPVPERRELGLGDHTVLAPHQLPDETLNACGGYGNQKRSNELDPPPAHAPSSNFVRPEPVLRGPPPSRRIAGPG